MWIIEVIWSHGYEVMATALDKTRAEWLHEYYEHSCRNETGYIGTRIRKIVLTPKKHKR